MYFNINFANPNEPFKLSHHNLDGTWLLEINDIKINHLEKRLLEVADHAARQIYEKSDGFKTFIARKTECELARQLARL